MASGGHGKPKTIGDDMISKSKSQSRGKTPTVKPGDTVNKLSAEAQREAVMQAEDRSERVKARNHKTSGGTGNAQPTMSNAKASEWAPSNEQGLKSGSRLADRVGVVPQLARRVKDAAQALGISVESFER
jgi:hypothetical protein